MTPREEEVYDQESRLDCQTEVGIADGPIEEMPYVFINGARVFCESFKICKHKDGNTYFELTIANPIIRTVRVDSEEA